MTILFPGLAHPDMWQRNQTAAPQEIAAHFQDTCEICFSTLFPQESKGAPSEGDAIISYDAVWTAETATKQARASIGGTALPSASAVAQQLNLPIRLLMANGWICSFDAQHNPGQQGDPHSGNRPQRKRKLRRTVIIVWATPTAVPRSCRLTVGVDVAM